MTLRRLLPAHIQSVTIRAAAGLLVLLKLFFDRSDLWIRSFLVVLVTSSANRNRHIWSQSAQRARPRDVDMARRAFHHVLALAAIMTELCRHALWPIHWHKGDGRFMASGTILADWLLTFPMTIETLIMGVRVSLESTRRRHEAIRPAQRRSDDCSLVGYMTDRAVVVIGLLLIVGGRSEK